MKIGTVSRAVFDRSLAAVMLLPALCFSTGCGRVGIQLLPLDGDGVADDDPDSGDAGASDGDGGGGDAGAACRGSSVNGVCLCEAATFTPDDSCGIGYCRTKNTPSTCVSGEEVACKPGEQLSAMDTTCDGVDDNCNGAADENYAIVTSCGVGYCRTTSTASRCSAGVETACRPGMPRASNDTTADGVDDDCDGQIDEDVCVAHSDVYRAGSFTLTPPAGCSKLTVKLWGGGGASGDGQGGYWGLAVVGGDGGAGGFASATFTLPASGAVQLYVGAGGKGCGMPGSGGIPAHNGGTGGSARAQAGTAGADGTKTGGAGGTSSGGRGGAGSYGGGGGGAGTNPGYGPFGAGAGGGAASVLLINGMSVIAGGGGGGGGAGSDLTTAGHSGGHGGSGCSGVGVASSSQGGGGGGGGVCQATTTRAGMGRAPSDMMSELPPGLAAGGASSKDCDPGGDGYAIVSYSP